MTQLRERKVGSLYIHLFNYKINLIILTVEMAGLLHEELAPLLPLSLEQLVQRLRLILSTRTRRRGQEIAAGSGLSG